VTVLSSSSTTPKTRWAANRPQTTLSRSCFFDSEAATNDQDAASDAADASSSGGSEGGDGSGSSSEDAENDDVDEVVVSP
jgi:hypothetical protein